MVTQYELSDFSRENEKIFVQESRLYHKNQLPEHTHKDFMEILYVLEGTGDHILNGVRSVVQKGDLIFLSYMSTHTFRAQSNDFVWVDICFKPDALNEDAVTRSNAEDILKLSIFRDFKEHRIYGTEDIVIGGKQVEFEYLVREMLNEYTRARHGYIQNIEHCLQVLLVKIFRCIHDDGNASPDVRAGDLINLIVNELNLVQYGELNMETVAKRTCVSYKYFSRMFKQRVGMSFTEFIHKKRVEKACELLAHSDMSIGEICEKAGFNDEQSFYRNFKKITDKTPGQYRKQFGPAT